MLSPYFELSKSPVVWSTQLAVRLARHDKTRLEQLARHRGRSLSELIREAIQTLLATEAAPAAINSGESLAESSRC